MPLIDWSPEGELATLVAGTLRCGDRIVDGPSVLDARWRADGALAWIDDKGLRRFDRDGAVESIGEPLRTLSMARIAIADVALVSGPAGTAVETLEGNTRWKLDWWKHGFGAIEQRTSMTISGDGRFIAVGYENEAYADYNYTRAQGRGFLVIDTVKDSIIDRQWWPSSRTSHPMPIAFDAKGKRIALAQPEEQPAIGAIRIGRGEKYAREHPGGARAVALDDRGILAAYAYAKRERRLRVDYLETTAKGPSDIAILESLWIEPAVGDIVALAFDRQSRRIACLDANGRVDVVPVP